MKTISLIVLFLLGIYALDFLHPGGRVTDDDTTLFPARASAVFNAQEELKIQIFERQDAVVARSVMRFLKPVLAMMNSVEVVFVDPELNPDLMREYGIGMRGEIVLSNAHKKRHITQLSYEDLVNSLQDLITDQNKWLVFLEGFGAREVSSETDSGLASALVELKKRGYPVARMLLSADVVMPDNVKAMVLPAITQPLQQDELKWIQAQIADGISLWWLQEPELMGIQPELELMFDVSEATADLSSPLVIQSMSDHPINQYFDQPIQLVQAMKFSTLGQPVWPAQKGQVYAAAQTVAEARLLVSGDADFISNQYLYLAANKAMMFRMIDWILHYDDRIKWKPETKQGTQIQLSQQQIMIMAGGMLVLVPLFFLIMAFRIWLMKRKNRI